MKNAIIFLVVLLTCSPSFSQPGSDFWEQTNGPFGGTINDLAINSNGDIFAGTDDGPVFRSSDNGDDWSQLNTGLTLPSVRALAINSNGDVYAGTENGGIFRSTDNVDTWSQINTGLTTTVVWSLAIKGTDHIFAGTNGGGVFRSVESTTSVQEISTTIPSSFALEQNYPNSFNPETVIRFALPAAGDVTLKVYNILGQEIRTLVAKNLHAGSHNLV